MGKLSMRQEIILEIDGRSPFEQIIAHQGDIDVLTVEITLVYKCLDYIIPENTKIRIMYIKPDGYKVLDDCTVENGKVIVTYTPQMLSSAGIAKAQILLQNDTQELKTPEFYTRIYPAVYGTVISESSNEWGSIISQVEKSTEAADEAKSSAIQAQSYARGGTGTRDGENIDNAKYYKEQANLNASYAYESANTATEKANEASSSALVATNKANAASDSASAAASSEINAAASESATSQKAAEAADSANIAINSASNASVSKESAEKSAIDAESFAHGDTGKRANEDVDNSKYYYEQARRISEGLQGSLLPMGTISFSQLSSQTKKAGYMYNIRDEFTTDTTFKEGDGFTYPPGTNIYYTVDGYWDCLAGTMVSGVKGKNETSFRTGYVEITPGHIGALELDGDSKNNIVTFTSADSANSTEWEEVDTITSGEKHSSFFNKISKMFKNIRYLYEEYKAVINILKQKQETITGAATTITTNNLTANRTLISNASGKVAASSITTTQLGYLSGATSNIQTQINSLDNTVVKSNDVGSDFYKVSTLRTFVDTNNAYIQGTKGDYIFGISAFSDKRIKNNIKDSTVNALDVINKIKMREFDFIDEKYGDHNDIGYVAQELMEIVPEAVVSVQQDKEKIGYEKLYQVEDKHLIKYLVKAVQELSAEVEKLN